MKTLFLSLVATLAVSSLAAQAGAPTPPEKIDRATYPAWLMAIGAPSSPYFDYTFRWYEAQLASPLPKEVSADPEKIFVSVAAPLAEARKVETAGDAEEGSSYGLETYAIIDAPVTTAVEATLFRWGKPVGQVSGTTFPNDTVFGWRKEAAVPEWGPGSYKTITMKKNGGIAADMNDVFSLLVRGNPQDGYVLIGSFISVVPGMTTTSTTYITIIMLRPTPDGKTEYRVAGLLTGQNYSFFGGVENGRKNFGFNVSRIRDGQKDFISQVMALKNTGKIPERKP